MASCWLCCLFLVVALNRIEASAFDRVLDDIQPCKEKCEKTYPLHTYPNAKHYESCKRGCRFFTLVEFINNHENVNSTTTKDACTSSCMEAYSQIGDRYACNIGCSNQLPFAVQQQEEIKDDPPSMHSLIPLMFVHTIYNNMVDHVSRIMSVSWSFYVQEDDTKVVMVPLEPEVITEYLDMDDVDYDKVQDDSKDSTVEALKGGSMDLLQLEKSSAEVHFQVLPDMYNYYQNQKTLFINSDPWDTAPAMYNAVSNDSFSESGADWLGCVARKSGLPRWLICLTVLFSALAMIWLCLTSAATAPEHHLKAQKLSLYGDMDSLCLQEEKIQIQPPREYDAPPLPLKISLQKL